MDDTNSLIEQRKAKLAALRARGIDPFKNKFTPTETCAQARAHYTEGREVALAGRITAHREMGKSMFLDIRDQSGRIQIYAQKNVIGEDQFDIFRHLDLGDFIGLNGTMFTTRTNEISVKINSFTILSKALRPPPAKWHGLEDTEIRYRQRYLDLMANPEVKDVFLKRSQIIAEIRNFLHSRGFVEVETPMMQAIPGGAAAQPFKTHHNALGCDFYMRIALELPLKRMLVGGVDKVFEIGRVFRNEGLSRKHNPEFTMLEAYQAFGDYESMMELVESLVVHLAKTVVGTLVIPRSGQKAQVASAIDRAVEALNVLSDQILGSLSPKKSGPDEVVSSHRDSKKQLMEELWKHRNSLSTVAPIEVAQAVLDVVAKVKSAFFLDQTFIKTPIEHDMNVWKNVEDTFGQTENLLRQEILREPISLDQPWKRSRYKDLVREKAGV